MYTPIFEKDEVVTPEVWMERLAKHNIENTDHGMRCSCMDEFSQQIRKMFPRPQATNIPDDEFTKWLEGPENKLRNRMMYIFNMVVNSWGYI